MVAKLALTLNLFAIINMARPQILEKFDLSSCESVTDLAANATQLVRDSSSCDNRRKKYKVNYAVAAWQMKQGDTVRSQANCFREVIVYYGIRGSELLSIMDCCPSQMSVEPCVCRQVENLRSKSQRPSQNGAQPFYIEVGARNRFDQDNVILLSFINYYDEYRDEEIGRANLIVILKDTFGCSGLPEPKVIKRQTMKPKINLTVIAIALGASLGLSLVFFIVMVMYRQSMKDWIVRRADVIRASIPK